MHVRTVHVEHLRHRLKRCIIQVQVVVQHVEHENGVQHEVQVVVILIVDIMEQVHVVRHQQHVEHESGVQHEVQVVVQSQHDIMEQVHVVRHQQHV